MKLWQLDVSQLKHLKLKDYILRFLFGGAISVLAAFITQVLNVRIGGVFMAFPAILLASLTMISREDGKYNAEEDARGGIVGAVAFVVTAIVLILTLRALSVPVVLFMALIVWLICAFGLYALSYTLGWLRVQKSQRCTSDARKRPDG
jgi:hypothetical protein